jgi:long-chain fatty acid transport protein
MRRWVTAIALAVAAWAPRADASPEDLFGYGARSSAMGATGTAHAIGYESAWHNPALASGVRQNRLVLGYVAGVFRLDAEGEGLPGRVSPQPMRGTIIGAELPIPLGGKLRDRVGIAMAFYEPTDVVVRGRVLYPEKTQFPILPDRAQSVTIRAGIGVDVGWGVRVGSGFAALAEIAGDVVAATDATGRVGTRVEDQLVATYAPQLGATYDLPLEGPTIWRVGIAWRGTLDARFAVTIDGTKLSSLQIPLLNIAGTAQYDPAQTALEVARVSDLNVLAVQGVYKKWSSFPGILEPTVRCTEPPCGLVPPTIDWRDTFAVRIGADQGFRVARGLVMHARGGAFYETTPLPDTLPSSEAFSPAVRGVANVPTRYFDADRVALTLGTGLALSDPLPPIDLDLYVQHHRLLARTIRSTDPTGATLSEGEASGSVTVFGFTAGVRF